ncbi:hypothetical protein C1H46_041961 [Malus baccata]|uniref:Uncharacterized protein n=1 Tax=Malus baccata TaxID=106549 RepID=A0A540KE81_MALBA|nr:hypothetical protein C1H46_041961 [Malus baccata]
MGASLTISRLLKAPNSLVVSTITTAATPKTSIFSPKSFSSKISSTPLTQNLSSASPPSPSNQSLPPSPSTTSVPERPSPTSTVSDPLLPRYELRDRLRGVAAV